MNLKSKMRIYTICARSVMTCAFKTKAKTPENNGTEDFKVHH